MTSRSFCALNSSPDTTQVANFEINRILFKTISRGKGDISNISDGDTCREGLKNNPNRINFLREVGLKFVELFLVGETETLARLRVTCQTKEISLQLLSPFEVHSV